jgi:hypothetical protein
MSRKKPRLNDEHKSYNDRVRLFQHYTNGGPQPEPPKDGQAAPSEVDPDAAERLLSPGDCVWPPELVRLREAIARARDEDV